MRAPQYQTHRQTRHAQGRHSRAMRKVSGRSGKIAGTGSTRLRVELWHPRQGTKRCHTRRFQSAAQQGRNRSPPPARESGEPNRCLRRSALFAPAATRAGRSSPCRCIRSGCGVFGPVLPQRILCCGFIAETGFLIPPKDNGPHPSRLAARVDIERGRTAGANSYILSSGRTVGASPRVLPSRRYALRLLLPARAIDRLFVPRDIGGQIFDGWLPMSDRCRPQPPRA